MGALMTLRKCVACKSEIAADATICAPCGTRQDWLRYLQFGSVIISLLVGLVSVSGIAFSLIYNTFHESKAEIEMSVVRVESIEGKITPPPVGPGQQGPAEPKGQRIHYNLKVAMLMTNKGNLAGAVIPKAITLRGSDGSVIEGSSEEVFTLDAKDYKVHVLEFHIKVPEGGVLPIDIQALRNAGKDVPRTFPCGGGQLDIEILDHGNKGSMVSLPVANCAVEVHFIEGDARH